MCVCVCDFISLLSESEQSELDLATHTKCFNCLNLNDQWIIKVKFKVFYSSNHFMVLCIACSVMLVQSVPYLIFSPGPRIGVCMCVCVCVGGRCCHDRVACRAIDKSHLALTTTQGTPPPIHSAPAPSSHPSIDPDIPPPRPVPLSACSGLGVGVGFHLEVPMELWHGRRFWRT